MSRRKARDNPMSPTLILYGLGGLAALAGIAYVVSKNQTPAAAANPNGIIDPNPSPAPT
jgi:hypothetical protein